MFDKKEASCCLSHEIRRPNFKRLQVFVLKKSLPADSWHFVRIVSSLFHSPGCYTSVWSVILDGRNPTMTGS